MRQVLDAIGVMQYALETEKLDDITLFLTYLTVNKYLSTFSNRLFLTAASAP